MNNPFDTLIDSYLDKKVGTDKFFLNDRLSKGLQAHIQDLQDDNLMTEAGIGNAETKDPHQRMRGDKIYWLDKSHDNIFEQEFLSLADEFINRLNSTCYTGINDCEFQMALYETGSFYKKHKDQFKNDDNRKFSLISYLNDDWQQADGGQLLIYRENEVQQILPHAQSAVLFKSDEMEHEVTIATRPRMSITGWLKRVS